MSDEAYPIIHDEGLQPCNQTAFFFTRRVMKGEVWAVPRNIRFVDGHRPIEGEYIRCHGCGKVVTLSRVDNQGGYHCRRVS